MEGGSGKQSGQMRASPDDRRHAAPSALPGAGAARSDPSASAPPSPHHSQSPGQQSTPTSKPIRRRMRVITSCLECRRRKLKCNKNNPCENCVKFSRECVYLSSKLDEASQIRLTEIKEKVGSLERSLERDVAKSGSSRAAGHQGFIVDEIEYETFEGLDPWPSDTASADVAYDDDNVEGAEDLLDVGVQIGRMRITDRVGGLARPSLCEEMTMAIDQIRDSGLDSPEMPTSSPTREFMHPGSTHVQPSSELMFGRQAHPRMSLDMMLPTKAISDGLMEQYFRAVHPVAMCVHRPSFRAEYGSFWNKVYSNVEPRPSTQALMFAVMFSAAVSLGDEVAVQRLGHDRDTLLNNLKAGVESSLCQASFLRATRVETLQALIIYLIPFCRAELPRAVVALVGAAIRLAECIGLHRDGEYFGFNPRDTHVRRLLWHQLCILDIRVAETHGPRPSIRREDYDTKLPPNSDEEAIRSDGPPPEPQDQWTPMIFSLIRFEINEIMRAIWVDRRKLGKRQMLLTEMLSKTEDFRKRMIEKYEGMLHDEDPYQRYAKLVMHLLLYKLYALVLQQPYHSPNLELPQRLHNVIVMAGIMTTEIAIRLENDVLFADWAWYFGAYSQHQAALLLAIEIQLRPAYQDAARIWRCLDYVFNLDRNLPPNVKLKRILGEVWMKTARYGGLRRSRPRYASGVEGSGQFERERQSVSPGRPGGKVSEHGRQSQHLHPYYQSSGPSVTAPERTDPTMLMGQYGVGGAGSSTADSAVQPGVHQGAQTSAWPEDIDWEAVNAIFPVDPATGEVNLAGYHDPSISINWQQWEEWG